jgi:hypothetical protein
MLAFSVSFTFLSLYFPSVTRRFLLAEYSASNAFLLRAFNLNAALALSAITFALASMS